MRHGRPIIGILGGIGSGKSFVADLFAEVGCLVIKSDDQVRLAYQDPAILREIRSWWGDAVLNEDGQVNRHFIADRIFHDSAEKQRLERLLHPYIAKAREAVMAAAATNPAVRAFVWDTPLLLETGLHRQCDVLVFVEAPLALRVSRVAAGRAWSAEELARRENSQFALDSKRQISDYVVHNTADAAYARSQVREVLTRILESATDRPAPTSRADPA